MNRFALTISRITIVGVLCLSQPFTTLADEPKEDGLHIEAQPLSTALREFSEQTGLQVGYASELAEGKSTEGVEGIHDPDQALESLLAASGLKHTFVNDQTVVIRAVGAEIPEDEGGGSNSGNARTAGATPRQVMMAQATAEQSRTSRRRETDGDEDENKRPLEEIVVTGTNIRGIAPESSPTQTFYREDIQITGAATAQDFIKTLSANFGGGSNSEFVGLPSNESARFNNADQGGGSGSSVNLRGLGSGSTLVLLNGHRLAPSSGIGDFIDISLIPASALERVEVLTDGASSIYGSDAIAGVVNFILRDDFDGAEASLRYGTVTNGEMDEYRANATVGKTWDGGHGLAVYEYFKKDNLSAGDRSFSRDAVLSSGLFQLPTDLLPSQERHSVLAAASQAITPDLEAFADFTFSKRETGLKSTSMTGIATPRNSESKNWNISGGGLWRLSDTWFFDFSGTYSNLSTASDFIGTTSTTSRQVDSTLWTADAKASGPVFPLSGGEVKLAVGGHYRVEDFSNMLLAGSGNERSADRDVYAVFGEAFIPIVGPDNAMPGIARLEINASGRFDHFSDFGSTTNPKVGVLWSPFEGVNLRSSYSTSFNPPPLGRVGTADLGAIAFPTAVFNTLLGLTPGDPSIADVVAISVSGTGKDLTAENARAVTAGADFDRQWRRHSLTVSATWFDIKFEDRLGTTPTPDNNIFNAPNLAFNNPELFPEGTVIFFPSSSQITNVLDSLDRGMTPFFGADPLDASILNFANVVRNLSLTFARGIDFDFAYTYDSDIGEFLLGLDGTFLEDLQEQAGVTTPLVEQVNTLFNPVDLKLRGRAGYAHEGFFANIFVNYADSYRVDDTVSAAPIDSWTTVDLSLSYDTRQAIDSPILQNAMVRLSVINLFNENPPSAPSQSGFLIFGYDPTNASPLGRFIAFELTKRF